MHIPKTLNIQPQVPVPIQTRPTLSGGANTAGNHVMGTPALVKNPAFEFDEGGMGLLSKRKLEELVKQIDPDEKLDPEVEEVFLVSPLSSASCPTLAVLAVLASNELCTVCS